MDIQLIKTFVELSRIRHFGRTAERLHITQSAVSARIKLLEQTLGVELVTRKRNDIQLTTAGQRFLAHAESLLSTWLRAKQEVALEEGVRRVLSVGYSYDLWQILVADWVGRCFADAQGLGLSLEAMSHQHLVDKVASASLDVGLMFDPPKLDNLEIRELCRETLLLVTSDLEAAPTLAAVRNYIFVDWGSNFALRHAQMLGETLSPRYRINQGGCARDLLCRQPATAYLAKSLVEAELREGSLRVIEQAPEIERSAYAVYRSDHPEAGAIAEMIGQMKTR